MGDNATIFFQSPTRVRLTWDRPEAPGELRAGVAAFFFDDPGVLACDKAAVASPGWNRKWPAHLHHVDTYHPVFDETRRSGHWPTIRAIIERVAERFPNSPVWYGGSSDPFPVEYTPERRLRLDTEWNTTAVRAAAVSKR